MFIYPTFYGLLPSFIFCYSIPGKRLGSIWRTQTETSFLSL